MLSLLSLTTLVVSVVGLHQATSAINLYTKCQDKDVLVVGDGDLAFGRCLAQSECVRSLTVSTLDDEISLYKNFVDSRDNVRYINEMPNSQVSYGINATDIPESYAGKYDAIVWNFPHVIGKQNIRYNRHLVQQFCASSAKILAARSGQVFIALTAAQSGVSADSSEEWNRSWKLAHQAAEAGLLLTEMHAFDERDYPGYTPKGHRGHGGAFSCLRPELYTLRLPGGVEAMQAPLYTHEVHLLLAGVAKDLPLLESSAAALAQRICSDAGYAGALWVCQLVDLYVCPRTGLVSHTLQIGYCSLELPVGRAVADALRRAMEAALPPALNMRPRVEKHGGSVSQPYSWSMAQLVRSTGPLLPSRVGEDADVVAALRRREAGCDGSETDTRAHMQATARCLWSRRMGVLAKTT